jgi:hypothetical protein
MGSAIADYQRPDEAEAAWFNVRSAQLRFEDFAWSRSMSI